MSGRLVATPQDRLIAEARAWLAQYEERRYDTPCKLVAQLADALEQSERERRRIAGQTFRLSKPKGPVHDSGLSARAERADVNARTLPTGAASRPLEETPQEGEQK